jgi:hypothetical protein
MNGAQNLTRTGCAFFSTLLVNNQSNNSKRGTSCHEVQIVELFDRDAHLVARINNSLKKLRFCFAK